MPIENFFIKPLQRPVHRRRNDLVRKSRPGWIIVEHHRCLAKASPQGNDTFERIEAPQ